MKSILKLIVYSLVFFSLLFYLQGCNDDEEEDNVDEPLDDTTAPEILTFSPINGAEEVPVNTNIVLTFSEPIDLGSIDNSTLSLTATGSNLPINGTVSVDGNKVTLDPSQDLIFETSYNISVASTLTDLAGNTLNIGTTSTFITASEPDEQAPTVISVEPENEAIGIAIDTNILVNFSEPIDITSVSDASVILRTPAFSNNIQAQVTIDGSVMTIDPTVDLEGGSEYTLILGTGLLDLAGNELDEEVVSTFITEFLDEEPPTVVSIVPENDAKRIELEANIVVTFSEAIDMNSVTAESVGLTIQNNSDRLSINVSIENNILTVDPELVLEEGTSYSLTVETTVTDLAGNELAEIFTSGFTTLSSDNTGPTIQNYSVANNEMAVPVDASITITFDEPIEENSLPGNIQIRLIGTTNVFLDLVSAVEGNNVIVTPVEPFEEGTQYALNVLTDLTDLAGNRLRFAGSRVFRAAVPLVINSTTLTPTAFEIEGELTVDFSAEINPNTVTTSNFQLQEVSGGVGVPQAGNVEVNGSSVTFIPNGPLTEFETDYRLVVSTDIEDMAGNTLPEVSVFSFTTVKFSESFGYFIRNNSNPNSNTLRYDENSGEVISAIFIQSFRPQIWQFTIAGADLYTISNRALGDNQVLTAGGNGTDIVLSFSNRLITPVRAQIWNIVAETGFVGTRFSLRSLIFGNQEDFLLDGGTLTIIEGMADNDDVWIISRASRNPS